MTLTIDQLSQAELAAERRRTHRTHKKFVTHMTPWAAGHAAVPFEVVIEDISEEGIGLRHHRALELGVHHLLTVPLDDTRSVVREYVVVRCEQRGEESYAIGLSHAPGHAWPQEPPRRVTSKHTKLLFIAFGIAGLLTAAFIPLETISYLLAWL